MESDAFMSEVKGRILNDMSSKSAIEADPVICMQTHGLGSDCLYCQERIMSKSKSFLISLYSM